MILSVITPKELQRERKKCADKLEILKLKRDNLDCQISGVNERIRLVDEQISKQRNRRQNDAEHSNT